MSLLRSFALTSSYTLMPILCSALLLPALSSAATIEAEASSFTGDPLSVTISIEDEDEDEPGSLVITLAVEDGGSIGDLRGFFAQVSDESLLPGLSVSGASVTSSVFDANAVTNLGRGSNLNGGGTPCACDLGVELGSPGMGKDDLQSVSFVLSHESVELDVSLFAGQFFGVRATSVGTAADGRDGSSKLVGVVPEPTTGLLMMLGLAGLASRRSRSASA